MSKTMVLQSSTKSLQSKKLLDWELRTPTQSRDLEGGNVSYTSLLDVMSSVLAKSKHGSIHHEIVCCSRTPMKNRLVEQAARAYLQPTLAKHTKVSHFSTKHWQMFINKIAISFNFKNLFGPPIEACASLFSGLHFPDLPQAVRHLLGSLRPRFSGVLKS